MNRTTDAMIHRGIEAAAQKVQAGLRPLQPDRPHHPGPHERALLLHYAIDYRGVSRRFGFVRSNAQRLAVHMFIPEDPVGSVHFIHGYVDHTLMNNALFGHLLSKRLAVVAFDLPGHGLSEGVEADIGDFSEYGDALTAVRRACDEYLTGPPILLGHSTGCAAILEHLHAGGNAGAGLLFIGPLVRSVFWRLSNLGVAVAGPLLKTVTRTWDSAAVTLGVNDFMRYLDPLQRKRIPTTWVRTLSRWERRAHTYRGDEDRLCIIQGSLDGIVEWRYNLPFLQARFPNTSVRIIRGAKHCPQYEQGALRDEFLSALDDSLKMLGV